MVILTGGQDANNVQIEKRYGYTPNSKWPKSYTMSSSDRHFEPRGLHANEDQVPGVSFRSACKTKSAIQDHSFQENEFPELGSINSDRYAYYN